MPQPLMLASQDPALDSLLVESWTAAFARAASRQVAVDPSPFSYDAVADMVDGGATRWDVCRADATECGLLGRAGLLTELDWTVIDRARAEPGLVVPWWGMPAFLYSYVLAYDTTALAGRAPQGWQALWAADLPGRRILPGGSVTGVCEAVLLGDGVPPDRLYPLDLGRALARLAASRATLLFAPDDTAAIALLQSGAGTMALLRSTTAHRLRASSRGRYDFTWQQAILAPSLLMVPKENPSGSDAMRFIAAIGDRAAQVTLLARAGCGPADPAVRAGLSSELSALDPASPAHRAIGVAIDAPWYLANLRQLQPRWAAFTAG